MTEKYQFDRAAFQWVKDVVLEKAPSLNFCCYAVHDNRVTASNGRLTCSAPVSDPNSYLVNGKEVERILPVLEGVGDVQASLGAHRLTLSRKGFRCQIPYLAYEGWHLDPPGDNWHEVKPEFLAGLQRLRPFISDNAAQPWATAVYVGKDYLLATNNICLIRYDVQSGIDTPIMLPLWAIDFVLAREGCTHFESNENHLSFRWPNGAWMRSVLVAGQFPEGAIKLAEGMQSADTTPITPEWRAAFDNIAPLAESTIYLTPDMIIAKREQSNLEAEAVNIMPEGVERSIWPAKNLQLVIDIAEAWAPQLWPKAAPFAGKNFVGLIVGRTS